MTMNYRSPHHHHPQTLTRFRGLPGEYGSLEVRAESPHAVRLQMTSEFLDLNRNDAQEVIRVLAAWLAEPVSRIVIDNDGGTTVVIDKVSDSDSQGACWTEVVVVENEETNDRSHVEGGNRQRRPF